MRVLGIDPGTAACGYAIVHESDGRLRALEHGCWHTSSRERPELRLKTIFEGVRDKVEEFEVDAVAIEESFVGAVLVASALAGVECVEYAPSRVKQAVCGYGRAEKAQVQRMMQAILGLSAPPTPTHAADALAVAICHALASPLLKVAS